MRIVCPVCAAEYEVQAQLLTPGRTVKCARCGHSWKPRTPAATAAERLGVDADAALSTGTDAPIAALPAPAADPAELPPPAAVLRPVEVPRGPVRAGASLAAALAAGAVPPAPAPLADVSGRRRVGFAWAASLVLLVAGAAALVHWRADVVEAWPPAARLFNALSLDL